jgi:hypothetical protein
VFTRAVTGPCAEWVETNRYPLCLSFSKKKLNKTVEELNCNEFFSLWSYKLTTTFVEM